MTGRMADEPQHMLDMLMLAHFQGRYPNLKPLMANQANKASAEDGAASAPLFQHGNQPDQFLLTKEQMHAAIDVCEATPWSVAFNLIMWTCFLTGKERTKDQWTTLLSQAGFEIQAIYPTRGPLSVIEATPKQTQVKGTR